MTTPLASVVIPARNRPEAVKTCLEALARQSLTPRTYEVIVVDDGSEPALALDPSRWADKFDLKVIHQKNTGPAGARNRGAAEARGEFVAFTDDDCLPAPTWLENLLTTLRGRPKALVGGSTVNGLPNHIFPSTSQLIIDLVYEKFNKNRDSSYFFASNNIACRRSNLFAIGGFDADFHKAGAEDREFCDRWRRKGWPLIWNETALIEHRHAQNLAEFVRLYFRYGQGAFLYQAKRRSRGEGSFRVPRVSVHAALPPKKGVRYKGILRDSALTAHLAVSERHRVCLRGH